jgi:hypothetical protein
MDKSAYNFQNVAGETAEDKILRACEIIRSSGLGIRDGQVVAGGNNVMAKNALDAISPLEKESFLKGECAFKKEVIAFLDAFSEKKYAEAGKCAQAMVCLGWNTDARPVSFDRESAGVSAHASLVSKGITPK